MNVEDSQSYRLTILPVNSHERCRIVTLVRRLPSSR